MDSDLDFKLALMDQRYTLPKYFGISPRMVTYWKAKVVLPFFDTGKKSKMNVPQALWVCLIQELSEFGINTTKLAELAKMVWHEPRKKGYFKSKLEKHIALLEKQKNVDSSVEVLKSILNDPLLLHFHGMEINPFTDAVIECILVDKKPMSFYYFPKTGEYHIRDGNKAITEKFLDLINDKAYMCIPLMPFIEQIVSVEFQRVKKDITYLNQIENQIREIIMFKSPKYIELLVDNDNIKPLIIREEHKKAKQLADFFLNNKLPKTAKLLIEPRAQDNYKLTILTK
jgi:hypothetical protein|tara:strand:- start:1312 stop:2166 length:855 start_codon:yes stop_codon:yes gene_type:complete